MAPSRIGRREKSRVGGPQTCVLLVGKIPIRGGVGTGPGPTPGFGGVWVVGVLIFLPFDGYAGALKDFCPFRKDRRSPSAVGDCVERAEGRTGGLGRGNGDGGMEGQREGGRA